MRFVNRGEATQVRIEVGTEFQWILLWPGEEIDIPEQQGINYGFERVLGAVMGKIGDTVVETKIIDKDGFLKELIDIKGIGEKTAKEITKSYSREELKDELENNQIVLKQRFRDDVVKKLEEKYGA